MEYVLQVCQFVLSLLEVGMCYKVYDLLLEKESPYRFSGIIKMIIILGVGAFLHYNRLTTRFMSNILYVLKSLVMAMPLRFLYREKYSTCLSITLSYFSFVGLLHASFTSAYESAPLVYKNTFIAYGIIPAGWAYQHGFITDYNIKGTESATRGEIAEYIYHMYKRYQEK